MKRLFSLIFTAGIGFSAIAQQTPGSNISTEAPKPKKSFTGDSLLGRWVIDINVLGGGLSQNMTTAATANNYLNGVNMNTGGNLTYNNGMTYGAEGQVGFFFGKKRNFGIGTGFNYLFQTGDVNLSSYHVEYESHDKNNDVFRQLITANGGITEHVQTTNLNIPLVLKYKKRLGKVIGFTADAGILYNIKMSNAYNTNANFNYEAIYDFQSNGQGGYSPVYDNGLTPNVNDRFYTVNKFVTNPNYTMQQYFNTILPGQGYNTGLGVTPTSKSGTVSYNTGSVGYLVRPALNFFLSDHVALNFGVFYLYQPSNNNVPGNYMLTNKVGDYSSVLHSVSSETSQSYGINVGVRFFIGGKKKKEQPLLPVTEEAKDPSYCGLCDGSIIFNNLTPGQTGIVNYLYNGNAMQVKTDTVSPFGTIKLSNLCAGEYANIQLTMDGDSRNAPNVILVNPPIKNYSESSTNPLTSGACDGSITIHGLRAGLNATIKYKMNGSNQSPYTSMVGSDGTITVPNLCAGSYSEISATINSCTVNCKDITLVAPVPPAPVKMELPEITTPILFETNRTVIMKSSYPVLESAKKKLDEDKTQDIVVDGYTDITGKPAYNKVLSLKRAKAVKQQLIEMGVDPKRIKVMGHGSKAPVGDNSTPEGRLENRRAVMHLNVGQ